MKKISIICFVFTLMFFASKAQHILLPQPQEVVYGTQKVKIKAVKINSQAALTDEDKFAMLCLTNAIKTKIGLI